MLGFAGWVCERLVGMEFDRSSVLQRTHPSDTTCLVLSLRTVFQPWSPQAQQDPVQSLKSSPVAFSAGFTLRSPH